MRRSAAILGSVALVAWGEWANWRASRRLVHDPTGLTEVVVVLGYRTPGRRVNALNRWRVRAGLRSIDAGRASRLVLSGGSVGGGRAQAESMASYAGAHGHAGEMLLEDTSRSTWENVANVIPLIEDADRVKIVSNPTHALKARIYLARQRPDPADRLVRGRDYRFGEWFPLKPFLAAHGYWALRRAQLAGRRHGRRARWGTSHQAGRGHLPVRTDGATQ